MNKDLINLNTLEVKINDLKETLYMLMKGNNLTDKDVVKCSQKLDKLILEYQRQEHSS